MEKQLQKLGVYSTKEACEYLGIDFALFRYHYYEKGHLKPDYKIGRNVIFTKATLDKFKQEHQMEKGYTIQQAADYLGVKVSFLRHHMFNTRILSADGKRGKKDIFDQRTLDALREALAVEDEQKKLKKEKQLVG